MAAFTPYMKRVLVPFWVLRLLFMFLLLIANVLSIVYLGYLDENGVAVSGYIAGYSIFMVVVVACIVLDIVSIVFYKRRTLKPSTFLIFNCVQTGIFLIITILNIYYSSLTEKWFSGAMAILVFFLFLGLLIYASVIYHRYRKGAYRGLMGTSRAAGVETDFQHSSEFHQSGINMQPVSYQSQHGTGFSNQQQYQTHDVPVQNHLYTQSQPLVDSRVQSPVYYDPHPGAMQTEAQQLQPAPNYNSEFQFPVSDVPGMRK